MRKEDIFVIAGAYVLILSKRWCYKEVIDCVCSYAAVIFTYMGTIHEDPHVNRILADVKPFMKSTLIYLARNGTAS